MEVAQRGLLVPEQPQGLMFQQALNVRTTSLHFPIIEGTESPASGKSCIEAQAGFGNETVNPMQQANLIEPSSAETHDEKPLPVRQRHFRKPARVMRPAIVVKAMKKTTFRKDQEASFNRVATGLVQQSGGIGRPVREKKARRNWMDFETNFDAMDEIGSPARKRVLRNSPALRRSSPESPTSGDSAQEGLPNPARRALRPAPSRRTSSPEPEAAQPKKKKRPEGKKAEGKKKAGGPCAVCFHTRTVAPPCLPIKWTTWQEHDMPAAASSTWRRGSCGGLFPEEPLCNAHGTADLRGRLHLCPKAQAVVCHRSDLSGAEEEQFWADSTARWRAASISRAQEEQEQNKFMSHLTWLRGDDQAAAISSERDQQFRTEGEEVAHVASLRSAGRAVASNSLMYIEEQFREGKVAQDEFCRGLDEAHAANGFPVDAGTPSGTVGEHSGMAVGEQWGRAEHIQTWGVQSPMQRQRPAAEAAAVNSASAASAGGLSTAVLVSHLSQGVKRQSSDDGLPESVATAVRVPAAKRLRFDTSASAHAATLGDDIQQSNASAGGSDMGLDISDDVASAAACLLGMQGMQRRIVKVKRSGDRDKAPIAA